MKTEYLLNEQVERVLLLLTPVNRVVMRVALHTGLRIGDVLALRTEDLRRGPRWAVTEQKTGKRKLVALTESLRNDMLACCGPEWVFPGRNDPQKHRTRQTVWKDIKRAQKSCRLTANIGCHSARKIYAVELLRKYGDIEKVRKNLNHDDYSVTIIYAMADKFLHAKGRRPRHRA